VAPGVAAQTTAAQQARANANAAALEAQRQLQLRQTTAAQQNATTQHAAAVKQAQDAAAAQARLNAQQDAARAAAASEAARKKAAADAAAKAAAAAATKAPTGPLSAWDKAAIANKGGGYGQPIFRDNQWHVTKNGVDIIFDPIAYHAGKGYVPLAGSNTPEKAQAAIDAGKKAGLTYGTPIFKNDQWHVTANGKDMVFDPAAYHAGKGYVPLAGTAAPTAAPGGAPAKVAAPGTNYKANAGSGRRTATSGRDSAMSYADNTPVMNVGHSGPNTNYKANAQQPVKKPTQFPGGTPTTKGVVGKTDANYGTPRFRDNQWHVTKNGVDMVFDPYAYHAGKGYLPIGYKEPAKPKPKPAVKKPVVKKPVVKKPVVKPLTAAQKAALEKKQSVVPKHVVR